MQAEQHESHLAATALAHVPRYYVIPLPKPVRRPSPALLRIVQIDPAKCCERLLPPAFAGTSDLLVALAKANMLCMHVVQLPYWENGLAEDK